MAATPPGDEFALIARLFRPLAASYPGALGLTDDAGLIEVPAGRRLVVTTDAMVAGVHFLPDDPADLIARKLLRVNLSDLAAMAAEPLGIVLAAAFPRHLDAAWMDAFAAGLGADLQAFGVALIGGDTVATPGPLTLTVTAFGSVAPGCELRRSGAKAGDRVWVSGTIGDAFLGLAVLQDRLAAPAGAAAELARRYRVPEPRCGLGPRLAGVAGAGMDVSDGLLADLGHICAASGLAAVVDAEAVPYSAAALAAIDGRPDLRLQSLGGGDDYELLFTAPPEADSALRRIAAETGVPLTPIGVMVEGSGVRLTDSKGRELTPPRSGYRHFREDA